MMGLIKPRLKTIRQRRHFAGFLLLLALVAAFTLTGIMLGWRFAFGLSSCFLALAALILYVLGPTRRSVLQRLKMLSQLLLFATFIAPLVVATALMFMGASFGWQFATFVSTFFALAAVSLHLVRCPRCHASIHLHRKSFPESLVPIYSPEIPQACPQCQLDFTALLQ